MEIEKCRNCPCSDRGHLIGDGKFTEFDRWMGKIGITCNVEVMQKTAFLGTARIQRKVLEM